MGETTDHYAVRVNGTDFVVEDGTGDRWYVLRWHDGNEWREGGCPHIDRERVVEAAKQRKIDRKYWRKRQKSG